MSDVLYTKAEVDILLAALAAARPPWIVEASGTYALKSTVTSSPTGKTVWQGADPPPTTTGYATSGDVWLRA